MYRFWLCPLFEAILVTESIAINMLAKKNIYNLLGIKFNKCAVYKSKKIQITNIGVWGILETSVPGIWTKWNDAWQNEVRE